MDNLIGYISQRQCRNKLVVLKAVIMIPYYYSINCAENVLSYTLIDISLAIVSRVLLPLVGPL